MTKLSYEDKISIFEERKAGTSIIDLSKKYDINMHNIKYLIRLIDKHGFDILKTNKYRVFTSYEKKEAINRVLINKESIRDVSVDMGLSNSGLLCNWIKKYKENDYNIVERRRGRATMTKKRVHTKKNETIEEENERLKKENEYLRAELEYSKKLRAVVQARKNQQQKKK